MEQNMKFSVLKDGLSGTTADCLVIGAGIGSTGSVFSSLPDSLKKLITQAVEEKTFSGNFKEIRQLTVSERPGICRNILLVGTGKTGDTAGNFKIRGLIKAVFTHLKSQKFNRVTIALADFMFAADADTAAATFISEFGFQNYQYTRFKSKKDEAYEPEISFYSQEPLSETLLQRSIVAKEAVDFARNLQHTPGNLGNASYFADVAESLASRYEKLSVSIMGKEELLQENMNAYLAVCSGSANPPKMCVIRYNGAGSDEAPLAFVGKGLTFDSGGLSLKPAAGMDEMKYDKCGACVVIALMEAIARLDLKINVVGVAAFVENMPDAAAYRPGDLIVSRDGTTIEVMNTDAEGRLVLCDALSYTRDTFKPQAMIDLATLTGGCIIALGHIASGLISTDDVLARELLAAGDATGDPAWRLPLNEEYQELIDSKLADLSNSAGREASPVTAGAFLSRFTGNTPWAHLDIAGTAWNSRGYKYSTGRPLELLLRYVVTRTERKGA